MMGSNLRYMISGGAPLDALVQEHMKVLFCVPLMEGYGLTETFGPAFLSDSRDVVAGHVGGVVPCVEFKLKSIPELNYYADGPSPQGELLMRGPSVFVGYFQDEVNTKKVLDADGWFHSGDVAILLPNCGIKIIDRVKNIFKLSQGEYVSAEKLESIYLQAPLQFLVAIVVPDEVAVDLWAKKTNIDKADKRFMSELKSALLKEMNQVAASNELKGFEKIRDIYLENDAFSIDNNLLTPTLKLRRQQAQLKYKSQIDILYKEYKHRQ